MRNGSKYKTDTKNNQTKRTYADAEAGFCPERSSQAQLFEKQVDQSLVGKQYSAYLLPHTLSLYQAKDLLKLGFDEVFVPYSNGLAWWESTPRKRCFSLSK